jgi:MFS family permease
VSDTRLLTRRFVVVVLSGFAFFSAMGVLLPVVPRYVDRRLGGSDVEVGIAVGALAIGAVLLRPLVGRLGDRYGRRVLMISGAALVAAMAACAGIVETLPWLIGTRILLGVGEAAFFIGGTTMATDLAPVQRRGEAISYWSVALWGGFAFGPVLGEAVLDGSSYGRVWITSAALAAVAVLVAFATTETHTHEPHVERGRLIHPAGVRPGALLACMLLGIIGFGVFVPLYGPEVGIDDVGLVFLVNGLVVLAVRVFGARLPDRMGPLWAGSIATAMTTAGLLTAALWHSMAGVFLCAVCIAIGSGLGYPSFLLLALRDVPDSQRGSVVGTFTAFFDFASGTSGLVLGAVAAATSYQGAFGAGAAMAFVSFALLRLGFAHKAGAPGTPVEPAILEPPPV